MQLAEFELVDARQMRAELRRHVFDESRIVLGEDEQRVARMLGAIERPPSRDHHRAFQIRIVGRVIESGPGAHRMPDHNEARSIDPARLLQVIDRALDVFAQTGAALALDEGIAILAVAAQIDREDAIAILRDPPRERAGKHAVRRITVHEDDCWWPLLRRFGKTLVEGIVGAGPVAIPGKIHGRGNAAGKADIPMRWGAVLEVRQRQHREQEHGRHQERADAIGFSHPAITAALLSRSQVRMESVLRPVAARPASDGRIGRAAARMTSRCRPRSSRTCARLSPPVRAAAAPCSESG